MKRKAIYAAGVRLDESEKGALFFYEDGEIYKYIPLNFEPHSFYRNPKNPNEYFTFVKEGFQSARFDISSKQEPVYFDSTQDCFFYGHAQFNPDGNLIYATERKGTGKGRIVVRNSTTLEVTKIIPLPGFGPHDMILLNEGKSIAVVVDNLVHKVGKMAASEVLLLDTETGEVLNKTVLDNEELCVGHLAAVEDGTIFTVMHHPDKKPNSPLAHGMFGEMLNVSKEIVPPLTGQGLSIMVDQERDRVITTYPEDQLLIIWDNKTKKVLKIHQLLLPTGISFNDNKSDYLITSARGSLFVIGAENLELKNEIKWEKNYNFFAHLYRFVLAD